MRILGPRLLLVLSFSLCLLALPNARAVDGAGVADVAGSDGDDDSGARDATDQPTPTLPPPSPPQVKAAPTGFGRIEGVLLERGTKRPLSAVNIFVLPAKLKVTSEVNGHFVVEHVPAGEIEIIVNSPGFIKLDLEDDVEAGKTLDEPLYLQRANYNSLEATVVGKVVKRDDSTKTMNQDQFLTMPGAGGDPVKAVQNMPGVAHVAGFSSQVVIQGSAPQDTVYQIDDMEVPLVFHFGGLTSVISPEAVDSVDYLSAGYGPEYGRAMGGIVGLHTRNPATDRQKGFVFMDTMKSGGLIEGPIGDPATSKSSYLVAGRYSYLGLVLGAVLKNNSQFDLTVAPAYGDLVGIYRYKISDQDEFKLVTTYSHDELSFLFKNPVNSDPTIRGTFDNITNFYRINPQWSRRIDEDHAYKFSVAVGQDEVRLDIGSNFLDVQDWVVSQRAEYETKLASPWKSYFGLDDEFTHSSVNFQLPTISGGGGVSNPLSTGQVNTASVVSDTVVLAPYWRNQFHWSDSNWTWMPSLRADYFSATKEFKPVPRFAVKYDVNESLKYKAATGVYYEPPSAQYTSPSYGNPDLTSPFALHYTVGFEKDFRRGSSQGWTLNSDVFYRVFQNLIVPSSSYIVRNNVIVPQNYSNDGRGRSYGAEALLKYEAKPWTAWLSYTLSRSLRNEPGQDEHLFEYDQTHNMNLVASYETKKNWLLSGRVRYVTGDPTTPIVGSTFDADNDVYIPTRGAYYSQRSDAFFQVDARFDRKWIYDTWILSAYLDIQNLTNRKNTEGIRYSYDYSQQTTVSDLPILPTLGVKGEF